MLKLKKERRYYVIMYSMFENNKLLLLMILGTLKYDTKIETQKWYLQYLDMT